MLIHFKPSIKTTFLMLLFIAGSRYLSAGNFRLGYEAFYLSNTSNPEGFYLQEQIYYSQDTVKTGHPKPGEAVEKNEFSIHETVDFHVNSEILYLSIDHFRKNESKKMFSDGQIKEKELSRISAQTDSLRKVYASSPGEKKDEIAVLILKSEEHSMILNSEIPVLYQNARNMEDQYWQAAPLNEKVRFQEKIKSFRDSLALQELKEEKEKMAKILTDTILISHESLQRKEVKTETVTSTIVYKIQIGAYKGKIPDASNKMIKKLSMLRKVENYSDEKGVKVYTTGNLKTYQEAVTLQAQVKQEGVKNPVIMAFQKGKKITVDEARKLNNEL
jgi:hypothetical protein